MSIDSIQSHSPSTAAPERVKFSSRVSKAETPSAPSTLEKAKVETPTVSIPPALTPPKKFSMLDRINLLLEFEALGGKLNALSSQALDENHIKLNKLSQEQAEQLEKKAKQTQKKGIWELLKKIGQCVLAAVSCVLGLSLVATGGGTLIGGLLIASGVLSIVNLVLSETESWDWIAQKLAGENDDLRKKLIVILPTAVGIISALMGLAGTAATLAWSSIDWAKKVLVIAQTASNFATGVATMGKGVVDAKVAWTEAELTDLQKQIKTLQYRLERLMGQMETLNEEEAAQAKQLIQTIKLYKATNQMAFQRA